MLFPMDVSSADGGFPRDSPAVRLATTDVPCLRCGYNLRGLQPEGACPECGTPIVRALRGNLLIYSAPEYVAKLHRGLLCILLAIVTLVGGGLLLLVAFFCVQVVFPEWQWLSPWISNIATVGSAGLSVLSLIGWWLFSTPDEAIIGRDVRDTPRRVLRIAVVLSAAVMIVDALGELHMYQYLNFAALGLIGGFIGLIAWLAQVFASLLYVQWLAKRLPDRRIAHRARIYLWLLPLVYVIGFCVFLLGPLVAMVLYFILLNDVRVRLGAVRRHMAPEGA